MSMSKFDDAALRDFSAEIESIPPRPHHSALLTAANHLVEGVTFKYALNRGGWYRPGGLISADGETVADNLEAWVIATLGECGGDMDELVERHIDSGLIVTRHTGRTHYLTAVYGAAPSEVLQLEVEELQEIQDRKLIDPDALPGDFQELTEPIRPLLLDAQAVGSPRYRFRRLTDLCQVLVKSASFDGGRKGLSRMLYEWAHSSAASRAHFSEHWIFMMREHRDRFRNPMVSVVPVSRHARELKSFQWNLELSGVEMAAQLQAFDRAAGYPAAWYFHLVSGTLTPSKIAYTVASDLDAGFRYLPDSEIELLHSWMTAPYTV